MPVTLRPMTAEALPAWILRSADEYARDLVALGHPPAEAQRVAVRSMVGWFPAGRPQPGHAVLDVVAGFDGDDDGDGAVVGYLWLGPSTERAGEGDGDGEGAGEGDAWWVWDIVIDAVHRGRGLGRATMELAEAYARSHGARTLGLSVFGFNTAARRLYESLGYEVTTVKMSKPLLSHPGGAPDAG